jgi:hypothetical protein
MNVTDKTSSIVAPHLNETRIPDERQIVSHTATSYKTNIKRQGQSYNGALNYLKTGNLRLA